MGNTSNRQDSNSGRLVLKAGREKSVRNRHPWIFSGAIEKVERVTDGDVTRVFSQSGELLGCGYYNSRPSIQVRLLAFGKDDPRTALERSISSALALRQRFMAPETNAYRLINGEGDGIPGLVVDQYADVLVLQSSTLGIDCLKEEIVSLLVRKLSPRAIFEKSNLPSRTEEGLQFCEGVLYGEAVDCVEIVENGCRFEVDVRRGQKTGFFLDQRENRAFMGSLAAGRRILNCFSYTGGFSVYAARAGARRVDSLDISASAIAQAEKNFVLNQIDPAAHGFLAEDAFDYLRREQEPYELIILDPPAFAKKKGQVDQACRGYGEINRQAFKLLSPGGLLFTYSCSYYLEEKLFQQVLFQAARDAGRAVRILQRHRQAFDHPVNIYHPEGHYLKGFLFEAE